MFDRGESEILGFVLIFGMVVVTITILSATGYAGLENARDFERANNAQHGMEIFADNVEDVTKRGVPSRTTELKLADGKLSFGDPIEVTVSGERVTDPNQNFTRSYTLRPLVHDLDSGTEILYVGGALIRQESSSAAMVREPDLVLTEQSTVIPIVRLSAPESSAIGGSSTVLVQTSRNGSTTEQAIQSRYELTLNVTTPRADVWRRYLDTSSDTSCVQVDGTASCTIGADRTFVALERVELETESRR